MPPACTAEAGAEDGLLLEHDGCRPNLLAAPLLAASTGGPHYAYSQQKFMVTSPNDYM